MMIPVVWTWVSCFVGVGSLRLVSLFLVPVTYHPVQCQVQGIIPKLSNCVLLGAKHFPYITYCGCIKSSCPSLISYCQFLLSIPDWPFEYWFSDNYCLLSIVNWLLFITYYTSVETLTSIIQVSPSAPLQEPIAAFR